MAPRILVTGSSGFIGTHLTKLLVKEGIDHDTLDTNIGPDGWPTWRHDISYPLPYVIKGYSRVIHLAGLLGTHELFNDIYKAIDVNIRGTVNILDLARRETIPYTGITMAHVWKNPYETTKLAAERLAEAWGREYNFPVSYYTVYNAYGEGQAYGPGHPQKIIPTFATRAWHGMTLPIWGDGEQIVDLVYAGDIARLLLEDPQDGTEGGVGIARTVNEVAHMVWEMVRPNEEPRFNYLPMRKGEHTPTRDPVALQPLKSTPEREWLLLKKTVESYRPVEL